MPTDATSSLQAADIGIIIAYFICTLSIGLYFTRRAAKGTDEYFLGGRSIPWFILGITGVAAYIDVSGTMVQTSYFFMLGTKGYWVAYRGAVCLTLAFAMIFMGKWQRRSGAMTNPGLLELRFGRGVQGELTRLLSAISILLIIVIFIAYFFVGTKKFIPEFIPAIQPSTTVAYEEPVSDLGHEPIIAADEAVADADAEVVITEAEIKTEGSPILAFFKTAEGVTVILFFLVMIYTTAAGFVGVVYTDIFQAMLIFVVIFFVMFKAMSFGVPEGTPESWLAIKPDWKMDVSNLPANYEQFKFFGLLLVAWIVMNVFQGIAQPIDAWSSQRYYAAKDDRESSLVAFQWIFLFSFRFLLMMGIGILGLHIVDKVGKDPENVLPAVINNFFPVGFKGLFIAAMLAALMSTLATNLNSSAVYFVRDIYHRYICPKAGKKHLVYVSYATTISIMVLGVLIGMRVTTIDSIWGWVIMGFFTGVLPANIIKWFWWRFNGWGYAVGMAFGMVAAIFQRLYFTDKPEFWIFSFVTVIALAGSIIGCLFGKPAEMSVLVNFYKKIRPFGFWGPVRAQCDPEFVKEVKAENRRDLMLIIPGCVWHLNLFWIPCALVAKQWQSLIVSLIIQVVLSLTLYKYWYKNLKKTTEDDMVPA